MTGVQTCALPSLEYFYVSQSRYKVYQTNQKLQHKESHKINNPSYFFQTLEDFNKHDTDQILSKIQNLRSKNKEVFQFSDEILHYFLQDFLLNYNHIYISDNNYILYSTTPSVIHIIETSPGISKYLNRSIITEINKYEKINTYKGNSAESNTLKISSNHTFINTKTCVNGLIYAKKSQLNTSLLPYITLTGEKCSPWNTFYLPK